MSEMIPVRRELLEAAFDVATSSLDFGSGFLDDEQVEALRGIAVLLGVDPLVATPANYVCKYTGEHEWPTTGPRRCWRCGTERAP